MRLCCTEVLAVLVTTCLQDILAIPSTFVAYTLYTSPRSWNEARSACEKYQRNLVKLTLPHETYQFKKALNREWNTTIDVGVERVWVATHYPSTLNKAIIHHNCVEHYDAPTHVGGTENCLAVTRTGLEDFAFIWEDCSNDHMFACESGEGSAYFDPEEDTRPMSSPPSVVVTSSDPSICAQVCQVNTSSDMECWAFLFNGIECTLYFDTDQAVQYDTVPGIPNTALYKKIAIAVQTFGGTINYLGVTPDVNPTTGCQSALNESNTDVDTVCYCDCDTAPDIRGATEEIPTVEEVIEQLKKELTVDVKKTSAYERTKKSADDPRPAAKAVGAVGVAVLATVFAGIAVLDMQVIIQGIQSLKATFSKGN